MEQSCSHLEAGPDAHGARDNAGTEQRFPSGEGDACVPPRPNRTSTSPTGSRVDAAFAMASSTANIAMAATIQRLPTRPLVPRERKRRNALQRRSLIEPGLRRSIAPAGFGADAEQPQANARPSCDRRPGKRCRAGQRPSRAREPISIGLPPYRQAEPALVRRSA